MPKSIAEFKPLVIVAGPTASGKSALALELADRFTGVIINTDSMQVYSDLHVLTARPSKEDEDQAPHRLFGILDAAERCSAGRWRSLAVQEIEAAWSADRLPILTGGTGLYLKALLDGLSPVPDVPPEQVAASEALYDEIGGDAFKAMVMAGDPETARRLPPGDRQRLVRAHSVLDATGRSLTDWHGETAKEGPFACRLFTIVFMPERESLYAACESRFDEMIAQGALDEVRMLLNRGLDPSLPAMRALGVRELSSHLAGGVPLLEAVDKAKQATRNYAKRQMTWFRHQLIADVTFHTRGSPETSTEGVVAVAQWLEQLPTESAK